ncbi:MAG: secretin N-terminal domain-containing protein [Candidatus Omnitrophota bacterium]|nr:secretin N-terminal domain-containing protein [Candidatus Omnitrophota bacterium]
MKLKTVVIISAIHFVTLFGFVHFPPAAAESEPDEFLDNDSPYDISQGFGASSVSRPAAKQDKISLDLKGMDIVDVIKMISQRSGYNIIIGKNVSGKVTMFLKDVDIWEAFEIILSANNLAYKIQGGIIYIMTDKDYELIYGDKFKDEKRLLSMTLKFAKAQEVSKTITQIKSSAGKVIVDEATNTIVIDDTAGKLKQIEALIEELDKPVITRVFDLKYAQADKISAKFLESVTKGIGLIKIDERTNKIAITDYPDRIAELGRIIEAFDEKPLQVRIDAQIIEISPEKDEFKMGVDWDVWLSKNLRMVNPLSLGNSNKLSLGMATAGISLGEKYDYKGVLDLLRTIGKTKILSSPSIMAINNQEAKILVGTKEAYITSSTSQSGSGTSETAQTVNFVDVGVKLYVTPTISRDGFVTMKIKPEVSSAKITDLTSEGKITQVPIVTTSEAETTVTVKDGMTIVIAGLKKDKKENEIKKIPLLGDIPILGAVFRSVSASINKTELVVFLTPHIVRDELPPPRYVSLTKDDDIMNLVKETEKGYISRRHSAQNMDRGIPNFPASPAVGTAKDYSEYVRSKIYSLMNLMRIGPEQKGRVVVSFVVSSDGSLLGEPRVLSATSSALSQPVLNVVKSAFPFPSLPEEANRTAMEFQLPIIYD